MDYPITPSDSFFTINIEASQNLELFALKLLELNEFAKMGIDLYYNPVSPPCISVLVLAKALGVEMNLKVVNTMTGGTKTPEFLKLNPQHSIPTLVDDNGFSLWESRAILQYLCQIYDKAEKFYPKDPKTQATVNRLLYFDLGTFQAALSTFFADFREKRDNTESKKKVVECLEHLDNFLVGRKWLTGDQMTIADISINVSTSLLVLGKFDMSSFTNIKKWLETGKKEIPHYDIAESGLKTLSEHVRKMFVEKKE